MPGFEQFIQEQPISCNSRIRCINAYLKWTGLPLKTPKLREESKVLPTYTSEQLKMIVDYRPKSASGRRLHTLILVLIDSGLRNRRGPLPPAPRCESGSDAPDG